MVQFFPVFFFIQYYICKVQLVNCCHFELLTCTLSRVLSTVQQTSVNCVLSVRKAALSHKLLLQKFGNGTLYCMACMLEAPLLKFQCFGAKLRTVQRIQKELDESNGNNEGMAFQKPHYDCSDKNSYICWSDPNNHWKQTQQIDWVHSQGVSYQAGRAWRQLVFFIQNEKGPIFITGHEKQEERPQRKAF